MVSYPGNEITAAEVIRRYGSDSKNYEITKKIFGNVGIILFCYESIDKRSWKTFIYNSIAEHELGDEECNDFKCKSVSGFWKKGDKRANLAVCLRDALAHKNIHFFGDKNITRIIFWNSYYQEKTRLKSVLSVSVEEFDELAKEMIKFCLVRDPPGKKLLSV